MENVRAHQPHPPFPASVKDGYAVIGKHACMCWVAVILLMPATCVVHVHDMWYLHSQCSGELWFSDILVYKMNVPLPLSQHHTKDTLNTLLLI